MGEAQTTAPTIDASTGAVIPEAPRTPPANNALYLAAATLTARLASFVFVLYALGVLGKALYGNFTATYNFIGLFALLTDLGLSTVVARDVTQDRSKAVSYISNVLVLRLLCALVAIALSVVVAQIIIAPSLRSAVYVASLSLAFLAVSDTLALAFRFSERLAYTAMFTVATTVAAAGLRALALLLGFHVLALVTIQTAVTFAGAIAMAAVVYTRFLPRRLDLDPSLWPSLMLRAIPFGMSILLNIVYAQGDKQILYVLSNCGHATGNTGCSPVGLYNTAYLPLDVLTSVFVLSAQTATFSSFSRVAAESIEALRRVVRSSVTLMLAFGAPTALFVSFYARQALAILGRHGDYAVAAPALSVLIWALPCFLVLTTLYNALWAVHRATIVTVAFAIAVVFNVGLNILLIPRYSYMACSVLTVASELLNGAIIAVVVRQSLGALGVGIVAAKVALILAVTALVLWSLRRFGIVVGLPVGVIVTMLGLRVTRIFGPTEHAVLARLPLVGRYVVALL